MALLTSDSLDWLQLTICLVLFTTITSLGAVLYLYLYYIDYPSIAGIPSIPGGSFLAGHLYLLGADHASTAEKWSKENGWPVFQLRMGRRRAVILNSFEAAREWMVKNQGALVDRPWFYTFHGIVSKTSAATIGTSPWDERTKKQRRVVGSLTTGPAIQRMRSMLDLETRDVVSGLYTDGQNGKVEIMPHIYLKRLALNIMMTFCYGTRFDSVSDPLLLRILQDAQTIASFRSTNSNPQDFIPHLRYLGKKDRTTTAVEVRKRRDGWLARMLNDVRVKMKVNGKQAASTEEKKSVAEMLIENDVDGLTQQDIRTILGGLMSGGFETIFSTAIITVGMLSTPEGHEIQQKAYEDIMAVYNTPEEAFERCLLEEKSPYIMGLVKEALRFYAPLKLLPARQVYKEFEYQGAVIPKGLLVYVNAQAANFDKSVYGPNTDKFDPARWLAPSPGTSSDAKMQIPPPYHFAFGAGSRQCTAVNLSNRVLYAMFARLIASFRIGSSKDMPCDTHYVRYKENPAASNAIPKAFRVRVSAREGVGLEGFLRGENE
ncbi:cytochrome P450 [Aspergillus stella-maris]|uniref:cytochrome P450 n=1 Tax=Aspergillus stella-maris TaxID=1810926 RepID=UPI003CCCB3FC